MKTYSNAPLLFRSKCFQYFRFYFNFLYFLGFCPYKVKHNTLENSYALSSSSFRKILCVVVHLLTGIVVLSSVREYSEILDNSSDSNVIFAVFIVAFIAVLFPFTFICIVWGKQSAICALFELSQHESTGADAGFSKKVAFVSPGHVRSRRFGFIFVFLVTIMSVLAVLFYPRNIFFVLSNGEGLGEVFMGDLKSQFEFNFFIKNATTSPPHEYNSEVTSGLVSALSVFYYFFMHYTYVIVTYLDLMVLVSILAIRRLSYEFAETFQSTSTNMHEEDEVFERYEYVRHLVDSINDISGPAVLCSMISLVPIYSNELVETILTPDWGRRLMTFVHLTATLMPNVLAARASERFDKFKDWLVRNKNRTNADTSGRKSIMLYLKMTNEPMGVTGCGLFTITYRFIGTAVSILITYAIIAYQIRGPANTVVQVAEDVH